MAAASSSRYLCALPSLRAALSLGVALALSAIAWAQEALPPQSPASTPQNEIAVAKQGSGGVTCLEPPPMVRWEDYNGPLKKFVGTLGQKLDRPSVNQPNYQAGEILCSLGAKDKFWLFVRDTTNPVTFLTVAFNSALDQAENSEARFGQGMEGYGKRLGANEASDATGRFLSQFLFPTLLREDPRYYRLGEGSIKHRLFHAAAHTFVAHRDSGALMPNFSQWAGTTGGVLMSDVYHPGTTHGPGSVAMQVGINIGEDAGFDVLREFWPEIAKMLHVPFRAAGQPTMRPLD